MNAKTMTCAQAQRLMDAVLVDGLMEAAARDAAAAGGREFGEWGRCRSCRCKTEVDAERVCSACRVAPGAEGDYDADAAHTVELYRRASAEVGQ